MIDKKKASQENTLIDSDFGICDIDIDFKLNNGKGAWIVVLQKNGSSQHLPGGRKTKGGKDEF